MKRRTFIQGTLATCLASPVLAALRKERLDDAATVLTRAIGDGLVTSAVLHVRQREAVFTRAFGKAHNEDAMFLLRSISKPIAVVALMSLYEREPSVSMIAKRFA